MTKARKYKVFSYKVSGTSKEKTTKHNNVILYIKLKGKRGSLRLNTKTKIIYNTDLRHIARKIFYLGYYYDFKIPKELQKKLNKYRKEFL